MDIVKESITKWAVEILLLALSVIAMLLRRLTNSPSDSVKITYEQLALIIADRTAKAEKAENQRAIEQSRKEMLQSKVEELERELLFLKSNFYPAQASNIKARVHEAIAKDKTLKALSELQMIAVSSDDEELMSDITLLKARYSAIADRLNKGLSSPDEARREKNSINDAVLSISNTLD